MLLCLYMGTSGHVRKNFIGLRYRLALSFFLVACRVAGMVRSFAYIV